MTTVLRNTLTHCFESSHHIFLYNSFQEVLIKKTGKRVIILTSFKEGESDF